MIAIVTLLWDANKHSADFSSMYDESWVEKLYRGFERNLTNEFEFICFVDRPRVFTVPVTQYQLSSPEPDYGHCIEPYSLGRPMLLVGLDTVVTGNVDHLVDYCMTADRISCPLDPNYPHQVCNGVALVPAGWERVALEWAGQNDMEWIRRFDPAVIDHLFPEQVVSFKGHVKTHGLGDARIVYFHGQEKPHQLEDDWVAQHWNGEDMADRQTTDPRSGNHPALLPGEIIKGASGWKDREARAERRLRKRGDAEDRAAIRAARAAHYAGDVPEDQVAAPTAPQGDGKDALTEMKLADLKALYEQKLGEKPGGQMSRAAIEAALRDAG